MLAERHTTIVTLEQSEREAWRHTESAQRKLEASAIARLIIICESVLWPLLRAVKPSADKHVLDVLPDVWPKAVEFFLDVAQRPAGVLEGSLTLDVGGPPPAR